MRKMPKYIALLTVISLLHPQHVNAGSTKSSGPFTGMEVIPLVNGLNQIDLNGDGEKDIVFVAWRGNYNAHGYSLFTFYLHYTDENRPEKLWHLVPFFNKKGTPDKDAIETEEGADCFLRDIRVIRSTSQKNKPVTIIIGQREFGESYADSAPVKFVIYELMQNKEGVPGAPPFYFEPKRIIKGKAKYCDINEAFAAELAIGDYQKDRER